MKNPLLTLAALALPALALAQAPTAGPWTEVNLAAPGTAPATSLVKIQTLSPTFCWALTGNGALVVPNNAAGTTFLARVPNTGTTGFATYDFSAVNATTAFGARVSSTTGESDVVRTTDGGATWRSVTTAAQFSDANSFLDVVQFFDANIGIALGDPIPPTSGAGLDMFEVYQTINASAAAPTWTRIRTPALLQVDASEFALSRAGTALGNTVWIATTVPATAPPTVTNRVLRSTDQGGSWASFSTPLRGTMKMAFKDQNNGIAFVQSGVAAPSTAPALARTTDGGQTWTVVPLPAGRDTLRGKFYNFGIGAIPGRGFVSVGRAVRGDTHRTNLGVSFSADGISWYDLEKGGNSYVSTGLIACTTSTDPRAYQGYLGGATRPATSPTPGAGGLFQVSATTCALTPLATAPLRSAALRGLSVAPNPSATGVFQVALANGLVGSAQVTVFDALGRVVATRTLLAGGSATGFALDLSRERAGLYTLRLVANGETATARLSIE